ncbi:MAG: protein tyrosine phosphatase [Clostridiales bacterium]|nr:protein tyrosine phosphatase [Clostridiales bacterium]
MRRIIDIHAHVLPGVDDGSRSLEESCQLLERAAEQGVVAVVATPHYSRHRGVDGYSELAGELRRRIRERLPDFEIYLGQETFYHDDLAGCLREGRALSMAGSRYVLVEFDPSVSYQTLYGGTRRLQLAGYVPILAHYERYVCLRREVNLSDLARSGCRLQMNFESLSGSLFDRDVRWCRRQFKEQRIDFMGTDMHRLDFRPPRIRDSLEWMQRNSDDAYLERLVYGNAARILKGGSVE